MSHQPRRQVRPSTGFLVLLALVWTGASAPSLAQVLEPLVIVSGEERHAFSVEVADTDEARSRGLMFRLAMDEDRGMIFDFKRDGHVGMWMRNTFIPLDMLFIRADGTIARIAADTTPLSEEGIESGEPVRSVLELNAGVSARLGIKAGDTVEHAIFTGD